MYEKYSDVISHQNPCMLFCFILWVHTCICFLVYFRYTSILKFCDLELVRNYFTRRTPVSVIFINIFLINFNSDY